MNQEKFKKMLRPKEAGAYINFSESSLEAMRARNAGPAWHRAGKRWLRYSIEAVDAYLAGNRVTTSSALEQVIEPTQKEGGC